MSGTLAGGKAAAETNKKRYGEDFYSVQGRKGGKAKTTKPKGFAAMSRAKRTEAGRKGGSVSKRTYPSKLSTTKIEYERQEK